MPNQNSPNQPGSGVQGPQTTSAAQTPATPVNTQPTTDTDVSQNFEVRTVNPPLTPDQIVGIQEAPIQQQLPTLKLQKIEESQVKSKTLVGHLKAIEAKMIATEKLLEDVVKLQNLQIVTQKELHFRKKELYQNTFEEYLLDKSIDFGKKKNKDCTCISLPDRPQIQGGGGGNSSSPVNTPTLPNNTNSSQQQNRQQQPAQQPSQPAPPPTSPDSPPNRRRNRPGTRPTPKPSPAPPSTPPPHRPGQTPGKPPTRPGTPPVRPPRPFPPDVRPVPGPGTRPGPMPYPTPGVEPVNNARSFTRANTPVAGAQYRAGLPTGTKGSVLAMLGQFGLGQFAQMEAQGKIDKLLKLKTENPQEYKKQLNQLRLDAKNQKLLNPLMQVIGSPDIPAAYLLKSLGALKEEEIPLSLPGMGTDLTPDLYPDGTPIDSGSHDNRSDFDKEHGVQLNASGGIPGADLELYNAESQKYFRNVSNYASQIASDVPVGPHTPLPHPGYVKPQGSFIPKPNLRGMPGPMGNPMPWGYDPTRMLAKGGLVKPYADGGWLPGTGRVMAPKTVGNTTVAGYQNKFLGFNVGKPEFPIDSSGYNTGYSQAERTRYEQQNPKKHFVNSGGPFPELVNRRNLIGEAFANFGSNVNTIKSYAKRQEEMMRQMGYEPDGYVNLLGAPVKKNAGGGISLGGGIRFGGESSGLRQGSYATGSVSTSLGKMQTSAGFMAGNAETIEGRSASTALDQALYNIQAATPMIAPDGKEYYGPYMPELTIKPEIKEGLFGTIDVQAQTSFGESPSTSGPEDEDPEMTRNPKNPRSYILSRGGLRPAKSKSPARVSPTPTRVPPSNRLESGQSALRPTGGKPPVIPLPPQTIPIPSRKPSSKVGYDSPNTMDQMPSMFSRSNSVLR